MKRETKLGLVVSGSFLCLFGALMGRKLLLPDDTAAPDANTASVAQAPAPKQSASSGSNDNRIIEPGKLPLKTASMQDIKQVAAVSEVPPLPPPGQLPLLPGQQLQGKPQEPSSPPALPPLPEFNGGGGELEELKKQAEKAKVGMYAPNKKPSVPALPPAALPEPASSPLIVAKGQPGSALPPGPPVSPPSAPTPPTYPSSPPEPALTPPAPEPIGGVKKPSVADNGQGQLPPTAPVKPASALPDGPPSLPPAAPVTPGKVEPAPVPPAPPAPIGLPEPIIPGKVTPLDGKSSNNPPAPPAPIIPGKILDSPPLPAPVDPAEPQNKVGGKIPSGPPVSPAPITPPVGAQPPGTVDPINVKTIPVVDAPEFIKPKPAVKGTLVETFTCDASTLTFAAISKKMYHSEGYADALLLFNRQNPHPNTPTSIYQNPPVLQVGSVVRIPKTVDLEASFPTAIKHLNPSVSASPPAVKPPVVAKTPGIDVNPPAAPLSPPSVPIKVVDGGGKGWQEPVAAGATYQVKADAMIFQIAHDTLGDGKRWSEIYRLNPSIDTRYPIRAGTMLKMPPGARPVQ